MGEKDVVINNFLADKERFADICNFYLFQGKQEISAKDLQELDPVR